MEAKLPDARPLINVCDRHGMVGDLTAYLYANNLLRYIEGYVQKVSPQKTPDVVGALLDAEAPDDFVNALILSVRSLLPVDALVEAVEKRNRLKLLTPFLEHLIREGSTDPHVVRGCSCFVYVCMRVCVCYGRCLSVYEFVCA